MSDAAAQAAPTENRATGLDRLQPGESGVVVAVEAPEPLATRLSDLGFCAGTPVRMVRRAPLRDPCLYELRGYRIALRRREAGWIRVRPAPEANATDAPRS